MAINKMRNNLDINSVEILRKKEIEIEYKIELPFMDKWSIQDVIAKLKAVERETILNSEMPVNFL